MPVLLLRVCSTAARPSKETPKPHPTSTTSGSDISANSTGESPPHKNFSLATEESAEGALDADSLATRVPGGRDVDEASEDDAVGMATRTFFCLALSSHVLAAKLEFTYTYNMQLKKNVNTSRIINCTQALTYETTRP